MLTCDMLTGGDGVLRASVGALGSSLFCTPDAGTHASRSHPRASSDCNVAEDSCTAETSSVYDSVSDASLAFTASNDIPGPQLWLGNLAPEVDDQSLEHLLACFGLEWVRVCHGKGVAIASFASTLDAAAAKSAFDGQHVPSITCGAPLVAQFWSQRQNQAEFTSGSSQVEFNMVNTHVEHDFQRSPVDPKCQPNSRSSSSDGADTSPSQTVCTSSCGDCSEPGPANTTKAAASKPSRHLWLGNLRNDAAPQDLETLFGVFGLLDSVRIFPSKPSNFAFVNFKLTENAAAAKTALEGHPVLCLTGAKPLLIRYQHQQRHPHWPLLRPAGQVGAAKEPRLQANAEQAANNSGCIRRDGIAALLPSLSELGLGCDGDGAGGCGNGNSGSNDKGKGAADETPSRHLWLGNLLATAEKQALERAFSPFGPLESIRLFPERNFGFINFLLPEHAATARSALRSKPHPDITGTRPLEIRFQHRPQIGPLPLVAMHAAMAPPVHRQSRTSGQLHGDGAAAGPLMPLMDFSDPVCDLRESASNAQPDCSSAAAASASFNAFTTSMPPETNRPNRHLWLGNVPLNANPEDLELLFSRFGPLDSVRVFSDKNFAFVNFKYPQDAAAAKAALDGRPVLFLTGDTPLLVRYQRQSLDSVIGGSLDWAAAADHGAMLSGLLQAAGGLSLQADFAHAPSQPGRLASGHSLSFSQDTTNIGTWLDAVLQEDTKVGALAADARPRAISATSLATEPRPSLASADLAFSLTEAAHGAGCPTSMVLPPPNLFGDALDYVTALGGTGAIGTGAVPSVSRGQCGPEALPRSYAPFVTGSTGLGIGSAHSRSLFGPGSDARQQSQAQLQQQQQVIVAASGAGSLAGCFGSDSMVAQAEALLQGRPQGKVPSFTQTGPASAATLLGAALQQPAGSQGLGGLLYGSPEAMSMVDQQAVLLDNLGGPMFQPAATGPLVGSIADSELAALERIWTLLPPAVKAQWHMQALGSADSRW